MMSDRSEIRLCAMDENASLKDMVPLARPEIAMPRVSVIEAGRRG